MPPTMFSLPENVEHAPSASEDVSMDSLDMSIYPLENLSEDNGSKFKPPPGDAEIDSVLNLSHGKLKLLPHLLTNQLCVVDISENHLEEFPTEIFQLSKLTKLIMCRNKLKELPQNIGDLKSLTVLKASCNNLQSIPVSLSKLNVLKELNLSKNKLSKITDALQVGCKSLQYINLAHNQLQSWPHPPASVHILSSVSLQHNAITAVPLWLFDGQAFLLQSVDISANPISCKDHLSLYNSATSHQAPHLTHLNMSSCMMSNSDMSFVNEFKMLTCLKIGNSLDGNREPRLNLIRQIDMDALKCRLNLVELSLRNVALPDLPENTGNLEKLEVLDCRDNMLITLPDSICKLRRLRVCQLSGNSIYLLPDQLGDLADLIELRLGGNHLSCLPESFRNLKNLRWLDLYQNHFSNFPEELESLVENLKGLDLEHNYFTVSSALQEDVDWLSNQNYEEMLDQMRNHFYPGDVQDTAKHRFQYRSRGSRQLLSTKADSSDSDCSVESAVKSYYDSSDDESRSNHRIETQEFQEEESWEKSDSNSDEFDPIERPPVRPASLPNASTSEIKVLEIPSHVFKPYSFCPSDLHPPSTRARRTREIVTFPPEEGQFDDA